MTGAPQQHEIIIAPHLKQPRYAPYREIVIDSTFEVPLVAYRVWQVRGSRIWPDLNLEYGLRGIHPLCPATWDNRRHAAYCLSKSIHARGNRTGDYVPHDSPPPVATCTCGVSGYFEPIEDAGDGWPIVAGVLSVSGRAVMHDVWLRAETAQVEALAMNADVKAHERSVVERTASEWTVPVVELGDLDAFGRQTGQEVPNDLRAR